jgi:hypothetical protein
VSDKDCATKSGAKIVPALVVHRLFDESPVTFNSATWDVKQVQKWLKAEAIPSIFEFGEEWVDLIFTEKNPALFLFYKPEDAGKSFVRAVSEAAKERRGQIYFVKSTSPEGIQGKLAEYNAVEERHLPALRIMDTTKDNVKYAYSGSLESLTKDNVISFVD